MLTWKLSLRLLNLQNGAAIFWSRNFHTFKSHHLDEWILCKNTKDKDKDREILWQILASYCPPNNWWLVPNGRSGDKYQCRERGGKRKQLFLFDDKHKYKYQCRGRGGEEQAADTYWNHNVKYVNVNVKYESNLNLIVCMMTYIVLKEQGERAGEAQATDFYWQLKM